MALLVLAFAIISDWVGPRTNAGLPRTRDEPLTNHTELRPQTTEEWNTTEEWKKGLKGFLARFARFWAIAEAAAIEDACGMEVD